MKRDVVTLIIPSDGNEQETQAFLHKLCESIGEGYDIYSAIPTHSSVHYVLVRLQGIEMREKE